MKRGLSIILAGTVLICSLTGCGSRKAFSPRDGRGAESTTDAAGEESSQVDDSRNSERNSSERRKVRTDDLTEKDRSASGEETKPEEVKAETSDSPDASAGEVTNSPEWLSKLPSALNSSVTQLFIVAATDTDASTADISMHEKDVNGVWKQLLSTPGFVGQNGLCADIAHVEGCRQTPMGTYHFNKAFGIADDPGCSIPYVKVDGNIYWSGDQRNGMHYNEMVNIKDFPNLDKENSEHIVDCPYQYKYCMNISFNENGTPGRGSAIFLHCFGPDNPYTMGCVAIPENIMKQVMQRVKPDCVVIIDTIDNLSGKAGNSASFAQAGRSDVKQPDNASGFVLLSEAVPDAIQDIRYYSTYNFVGDRIDGYEEPEAILTREAAVALKAVSDDMVRRGYRLKIFDAYRPQRAVNHFVNWAHDLDDTRMKEFFYPEIEKDQLLSQGYIAEHSGHSRGSTVDLTLFDMDTEEEVDMGGGFDYFGELSHVDYRGITEEQYEHRILLRDAMTAHGFNPYDAEWWHFTLNDEPYPDTYFNFPVRRSSVTGR